QAGSWAINRPMLDRHPLLTQGDAFLNRVLYRVNANPHATLLHYALPHLQLLFIDRNNLLLGGGRSRSRRAWGRGLPVDVPRRLARMDTGPAGLPPLCGVIVNVDRIESAEHLHHTIVLTGP